MAKKKASIKERAKLVSPVIKARVRVFYLRIKVKEILSELDTIYETLGGKFEKPIKATRSGATGRFVKKSEAKRDKAGTVTETIKSR